MIQPLTQHLLQNHPKCKIIFSPTHQQQNRFLPDKFSLLLVYCQSCLPKLWLFFYHSFIQGQAFCVSLYLQLQPGRPRDQTTPLPPSKFNVSPISSPHEKSSKSFSSLTPPNLKAKMVFHQQFSKPVLLNLPLFLKNYSSLPTLLANFPPHGNKPTFFLSQKKAQQV